MLLPSSNSLFWEEEQEETRDKDKSVQKQDKKTSMLSKQNIQTVRTSEDGTCLSISETEDDVSTSV